MSARRATARHDDDDDHQLPTSRRSARSRTPGKSKQISDKRTTGPNKDNNNHDDDEDDWTEEIVTNRMKLRSGNTKDNKFLLHHQGEGGSGEEEEEEQKPLPKISSSKKQLVPVVQSNDPLLSDSATDIDFRVQYVQTPHRQHQIQKQQPLKNNNIVKFGVNNYPDTTSSEMSDVTDLFSSQSNKLSTSQQPQQPQQRPTRCDFPKCTVFWIILVLIANLLVLGWFAFHNHSGQIGGGDTTNHSLFSPYKFFFDDFNSFLIPISGSLLSLFKSPNKHTMNSFNDQIQAIYLHNTSTIPPTSGNPLSYYFINPLTLTADQFSAIYPASIIPNQHTFTSDQQWLVSELLLDIPALSQSKQQQQSTIDLISLYQKHANSPSRIEKLLQLLAINNKLANYHTSQLIQSFHTFHQLSTQEVSKLQNNITSLEKQLQTAQNQSCPVCTQVECPLCSKQQDCETCEICSTCAVCPACTVCEKCDYSTLDSNVASLTASLTSTNAQLATSNTKLATCQTELNTKYDSSVNQSTLKSQLSAIKIAQAALQTELETAEKVLDEKSSQFTICASELTAAQTIGSSCADNLFTTKSSIDKCSQDLFNNNTTLQSNLKELEDVKRDLKTTQDKYTAAAADLSKCPQCPEQQKCPITEECPVVQETECPTCPVAQEKACQTCPETIVCPACEPTVVNECPQSTVDAHSACQANVDYLTLQVDELIQTVQQTHQDCAKVSDQTNQGLQNLLTQQEQQQHQQHQSGNTSDKLYLQHLQYQNELSTTPDPLLRLIISTRYVLKTGILPPSLASVFDTNVDPLDHPTSQVSKPLYIFLRIIPYIVLTAVVGMQFFIFQLLVPFPILARLFVIILWLFVVGYSMISHMYVLGLALFLDAFVAFLSIFFPNVMLRARKDKHSYTIA